MFVYHDPQFLYYTTTLLFCHILLFLVFNEKDIWVTTSLNFNLKTHILFAPKKVAAIHVLGHLRGSVIGPSLKLLCTFIWQFPKLQLRLCHFEQFSMHTGCLLFVSEVFIVCTVCFFFVFIKSPVSFIKSVYFFNSLHLIRFHLYYHHLYFIISALKTINYNINYICRDNSINTHKCTKWEHS